MFSFNSWQRTDVTNFEQRCVFFVDMHVHSGRSSASIMLVFSYPKITEVDVATSEFFKDQQYIQPARMVARLHFISYDLRKQDKS